MISQNPRKESDSRRKGDILYTAIVMLNEMGLATSGLGNTEVVVDPDKRSFIGVMAEACLDWV